MSRTDTEVLVSDYVFGYRRSGKKCCGIQKIYMSVGNWTVELRQELHNIGLTYVWRNQQQRDFYRHNKDSGKIDVMIVKDKIF